MNTSLAHLPSDKQARLSAITAAIREAAPAELILLFGSHARGNWVEDSETGYMSDFDLLVVVESPAIAKLLKKAYIEARYSRSYRITAEELAVLGERVRALALRIERACRDKIASFA